jgi:hypothetical protein
MRQEPGRVEGLHQVGCSRRHHCEELSGAGKPACRQVPWICVVLVALPLAALCVTQPQLGYLLRHGRGPLGDCCMQTTLESLTKHTLLRYSHAILVTCVSLKRQMTSACALLLLWLTTGVLLQGLPGVCGGVTCSAGRQLHRRLHQCISSS